MTALVSAVLFGLNFVLFTCEGKVFLPDQRDTLVVVPGENATIAWKIDPKIPVSDLKIRTWHFIAQSTIQKLAEVIGDNNVTIEGSTTLGTRLEIIKPSTLVLKNVDKRFNGYYRFAIRVGDTFQQFSSVVTVIVAVTPMVTVNCSSPATLDKGDFFACECKGEGGKPPADVTWYKGNVSIVTGTEEAFLRLHNVGKNNSGMYRCEAKSGHEQAKNETTIELIVNYPPEKTILNFIENDDKSVTITCEADAHPAPTFEIFFCERLVISNKTYTIPYTVIDCYVGYYKCVAVHRLRNISSEPKYLSPEGPSTTHQPTISSTKIITTTQGNKTDNKVCSNNTSYRTEWYIVVLTLVSGIIIGILFSYIVWCSHPRWFRSKKPERNPEAQTTETDLTYQELDLRKMNTEDNYQSLRVNAASNDTSNDDDATYTQLSKTRDMENNYQSLT